MHGYGFDGKEPVTMTPYESYEWNMSKHDTILRLSNYVYGTPYFAAVACDPETGIILSDIFYRYEDPEKNYADAVIFQQHHSPRFTVTILGGDINGHG
jgi:hypothetical protein